VSSSLSDVHPYFTSRITINFRTSTEYRIRCIESLKHKSTRVCWLCLSKPGPKPAHVQPSVISSPSLQTVVWQMMERIVVIFLLLAVSSSNGIRVPWVRPHPSRRLLQDCLLTIPECLPEHCKAQYRDVGNVTMMMYVCGQCHNSSYVPSSDHHHCGKNMHVKFRRNRPVPRFL
jgi:hypothetical protein